MATHRGGAGTRSQHLGAFPYDAGGKQRGMYGAQGVHPGGYDRRTYDRYADQDRSSPQSLSGSFSGSAGGGLVGGTLSGSIDQASERPFDRPYVNGTTFEQHQFAESRSAFVTQAQAERLRTEEGSRRLRQQEEAEMKIKSIHSRMAELEKQLFTENESGPSKQPIVVQGTIENRSAQRSVSRGGEPEKHARSTSVSAENLQRQNPNRSAATRAAPPEFQQLSQNLQDGGQRKLQGMTDHVISSDSRSVDQGLISVLKDIRRELSNSQKDRSANSKTAESAASTIRSALTAPRSIDIDRSLQELRERAKAREELAKKFNARHESPNIDSGAADATTAKLFERARQLEETRQQIEASNQMVTSASMDAIHDEGGKDSVPRVEKPAVQRAGAPPLAHTNEEAQSDRNVRIGQEVSASAIHKEARNSQKVENSISSMGDAHGKPAQDIIDDRANARGTPRASKDPTPVVSASSFKDYTAGNAPLPPGWELKLDQPSGRNFYVNHELKAISWDRPRAARVDAPLASRSLSQSMNSMSSSMDGSASSSFAHNRSEQSAQRHAAPSLLNRSQGAATQSSARGDGAGEDVAPRYIRADRMGSSMDGAYYESEEKRRAEMQTLRGRATDSHWESDAAAPKRWTASSFLNILDGRLQDFSKQRSKPHGSQAARSHNNVLRTSLDSTRLATLEKEMMEDDKRARLPSRPLLSAREKASQWLDHQPPPDTITLNLLVSAKEKLRNYVFSKIDDDDAFDNSSAKGGDKQAEELHYSQWCAEVLKDSLSDDEGEDDCATAASVVGNVSTKRKGGDNSWMRASLTEDEFTDMDAQIKAWQV